METGSHKKFEDYVIDLLAFFANFARSFCHISDHTQDDLIKEMIQSHCTVTSGTFTLFVKIFPAHGSALVGSDPHERAPGFKVCQMKGTHIGAS